MIGSPFFINAYFLNFVLPFVLVFTLVFAVLQKSKILGDESLRINAIIGLVVGLILIAFPIARDIIVLLMPFLAVVLVILFVFMLLYGFIVGKKDGDVLGKWWKIAFAAILSVALIAFLLIITGYWDFVYGFLFSSSLGSQIIVNVFMIAIIIGVIIAVIKGEKS